MRVAAAAVAALAVWLAKPSAVKAVPPFEEIFAAVAINGVNVSQGTLILRADNAFWVNVADAREWRLITESAHQVAYAGRHFIALAPPLPVHVSWDPHLQTLNVEAPVQLFMPTQINGQLNERLNPTPGTGFFVNYDASMQGAGTPAQSGLGGSFEAGFSTGTLVLMHSFVARVGRAMRPDITRLTTTLEHDDVSRRSTLLVGDAVTGNAQFEAPVRFAGVQWASNFSTDPNFITFPTPSIGGSAALPSIVDVYVNGVKLLNQQVATGPFEISNLPVVSGLGQIDVTVKDAFGVEQRVSGTFYASHALLKQGLTARSFEIGCPRRDFGLSSNDYGQAFADATIRHGFTDHFSGEAHVELDAHRRLASLAGNWLVDRLGVFGAGYALDTGASSGGKLDLNYSYVGRRVSAGIAVMQASRDFHTLGCLAPCNLPTRSMNAFIGFPLATRTSLVLVSSAQSMVGQPNSSTLTATLSATRGNADLNVSAFRISQAGATFGVNILYSVRVGRSGRVSIAHQLGNSGVYDTFEVHDGAAGSDAGLQYDVSVKRGSVPEIDARVQRFSPNGALEGDVSSVNGDPRYAVFASGSLVDVGGTVGFTRSIVGSYGLVELPYSGVRIYANGQTVGRTDAHGRLIVPALDSYQSNELRIEPADLPVAANVPNAKVLVAPYFHSPVTVQFGARSAGGVLLTVRLADGSPMPIGSELRSPGGHFVWPVAEDGQVYLDAVAPGSLELVGHTTTGECHFTITIPRNIATIPSLGTHVCH